jgi:selenocysteine-specific elongation factor
VTAAIRDLLAGTGLADAEIVPVSVVTGEGLDEVRVWLEETSEAVGARAGNGRFRLAVDRCFTVAGDGTVVTGTVFAGLIDLGASVHVLPSGLEARVRAIHAQNRPAEAGIAGQRCALNLAGAKITKEAIHRSDWVVDQATQVTTARLEATLAGLPAGDAATAVARFFAARHPAILGGPEDFAAALAAALAPN